jgi:hypothetical protein
MASERTTAEVAVIKLLREFPPEEGLSYEELVHELGARFLHRELSAALYLLRHEGIVQCDCGVYKLGGRA